MKKNLVHVMFGILILIFLTTSAYPQWIQTDWPEGNSFFDLYTNQDIVFARIWDSFNGGRVFFTDDNGTNWAQISSADSDIDILSVLMWNNNIFAGTWDGFYRCTLDDINWEPFEPNGIPADTSIWSAAMIDNILFAGAMGEIYESSIEDANIWIKTSTGIPDDAHITSIVANGNAIFAGSDSNGVFIATDNETNWAAINTGLTDKHISQLTSIDTKLFAITLKDGVFITDSNGMDWLSDANETIWMPDNSGLKNINCLLPVNNLLFAGTDSNGIYLSTDNGINWIPVNYGIPDNTRIWSLAATSNNIFAGTSKGIWKRNPEDINNLTITAFASEGGIISPEGEITVYENCYQTFTITPELGYRISDVLVDGLSVGAVDSYTFSNVTADHTISVVFVAVPIHTITSSAGNGGSISPLGEVMVSEGSSQKFTFTPSPGHVVSSVIIDGNSVGAVSTYTFTDIIENHTIYVTFESYPYQINCGGGASSPYSKDQYYNAGFELSVTNTINTTGVTYPAPQEVYQTERWGEVTYMLPNLASGTSYNVRLHFSENFWPITGIRKFDVTINGTKVLSNYDILAETSAMYKAVVKEFTTTADTSGQIVIEFTNVANFAIIEGIEIVPNYSP